MVVVLVPESGDGIQAMKAGLMEIADIFVVNKADRPGADRVLNDLQAALHLRTGKITTHWTIPVLKTVAQTGEGVPELLDAVDRHREYLDDSGELGVRQRGRAAVRVREVTERSLRAILWRTETTMGLLDAGLDHIQRGTATPYSVSASILKALLG